jgi:hypothetical protein
MDLTFLFKLGSSGTGGCPAFYETSGGSFVVQGYTLDDDAAGQMRQVAANESGVEIPAELRDQIGEHWARERGLL